MSKISKLKSPYSYFGGKSRVADIIWSRLGKVNNYVEPFCGSVAVLLANPQPSKVETINDIDCFISNFWRAVSAEPEEVAKYTDYPVNETDLHARHKWLVSPATDEFRLKMNSDPNFYDVKIAGWWVWGMGASIGNNWLLPKGLNAMPLLSSGGGGVHGLTASILEWFKQLQERTRRVRVCCGDWTKVLTPSVTYKNKGLGVQDVTGILLDPPYDFDNRDSVYIQDNNIFSDVCKWAIENGENDKLRIALCGYEGAFEMPQNWTMFSWKANGGLANKGNDRGRENATKERIYFSPHCLVVK